MIRVPARVASVPLLYSGQPTITARIQIFFERAAIAIGHTVAYFKKYPVTYITTIHSNICNYIYKKESYPAPTVPT